MKGYRVTIAYQGERSTWVQAESEEQAAEIARMKSAKIFRERVEDQSVVQVELTNREDEPPFTSYRVWLARQRSQEDKDRQRSLGELDIDFEL